ncbi:MULTISPECIES: endolytic transglycosylase MltG [Aequorivita]|uniref:Endolytic murein transglycosylase n=1 Tax=Aequorivita iocasae TaxID=2803865 RepID=A0ABX7DPP8_9FLAO|nr:MULTISPECIES: endolytic transglycosylase MltG [Aequorivita]PHR13241.1 MAG: aminodeoxychorismate lyase [Aequorivita sp.]QQX75727.1 endolytic transglycosylase MltG [Aequorivita iocasae]UCA55186.1 endolytic transglycosylase MltG [Aequorivita sp. F7]
MYIKKILIIIVLLGAVGMGAFAWYVYNTAFSGNTAFNNKEAHVYISTNATIDDVAEELEPLLRDTESFITIANQKKYSSNIKPGHFILKKGMTNNDIVNTLRSKNIPINVKFNNQERLQDLAGHISNQIEADSLSLLAAMRDPEFLKEVGLNEETALSLYIPNTYEFYWNSSAETFRDRMKSEYERFWNESRMQKAKKLNLSPEQVMALASIIQKETAKVDERPRVAGVYLNRLKVGMLLQADPTVIYAIKRTTDDYNQIIKRVLYKDLEIDSPYNTYKYAGIPPGPITMPDISSIDAVLNPEKHEYYYFVADVNNFGYHKFAKSLAQHNVNKAEYVRWVNSQGLNR